jgi:hypothetical protein
MQTHFPTTNCLVTWGTVLCGTQPYEAVNIWVPYDSIVTVSLNTYTASERHLPSNLTERRSEHGFGRFWFKFGTKKRLSWPRHSVLRWLRLNATVMTDSVSRCFQASTGGRARTMSTGFHVLSNSSYSMQPKIWRYIYIYIYIYSLAPEYVVKCVINKKQHNLWDRMVGTIAERKRSWNQQQWIAVDLYDWLHGICSENK